MNKQETLDITPPPSPGRSAIQRKGKVMLSSCQDEQAITPSDEEDNQETLDIAAKHQKEIAELHESEGNVEAAIESFQQAADLYESENSQINANNCLFKVANMCAQLEQYDRAIELYEKVAKGSLDHLLKLSVNDHFFRAVLCHLANGFDVVAAKQALDKYGDWDPTFGSTQESKFLDAIITATEDYNVKAFTDAVVEYDSASNLDAWKTSLLLKIKKGVNTPPPSPLPGLSILCRACGNKGEHWTHQCPDKDKLDELRDEQNERSRRYINNLDQNTRKFSDLSAQLKREVKKRDNNIKRTIVGEVLVTIIIGSILLCMAPTFITGLIAAASVVQVFNNIQKKIAILYVWKALASVCAGVAAVYMWELAIPGSVFFASAGVIAGLSLAINMEKEA